MMSYKGKTYGAYLWLLFAVFLGGCQVYEVDRPIIPTNMGVRVPLSSPAIWEDGSSTTFSYSEATRDYRFQDDDGSTGTARVMRLRNNDYAVQQHYDGESTFVIHLMRVDPYQKMAFGLFLGFDPAPVAARHRVTLHEGVVTDYILQGTPENILNFLRAHSQLPLTQE